MDQSSLTQNSETRNKPSSSQFFITNPQQSSLPGMGRRYAPLQMPPPENSDLTEISQKY